MWGRYQPSGLLWTPGQYPSDAAGYDSKVAELQSWVLARLAWLESQFALVLPRPPTHIPSASMRLQNRGTSTIPNNAISSLCPMKVHVRMLEPLCFP